MMKSRWCGMKFSLRMLASNFLLITILSYNVANIKDDQITTTHNIHLLRESVSHHRPLTQTSNLHGIATHLDRSRYHSTISDFIDLLKFHNISIKVILGFSTGHVGTTTLGSSTSYKLKKCPPYIFLSEVSDVRHHDRKRDVYHYDPKNWNINREINHIRHIYGLHAVKKLLRIQKCGPLDKRPILVDLSHSSLYLYNGWVHLAHTYPRYISLYFIRIRRDRKESVVSLSSNPHFFRIDYYFYHPFENVHNVLLPVHNETIWRNFTLIEKLYWVMDETEARWLKLIRENPWLSYSEVMWAQHQEGSFERAIETVAGILNLTAANQPQQLKPHTRGAAHTNGSLHVELDRLDRQYQSMMGYSYTPG